MPNLEVKAAESSWGIAHQIQTSLWDYFFPDGVYYDFTSTGWATFGFAAPEGAIPSGQGVQVGALTTQTDVKCTWPDNSLKYAVVTCKPTSTGNHEIRPVALDATPFSPAPTWPTVVVTITMQPSGTVWTATLPTIDTSLPWLSGPLCREYRVRVKPKDIGNTDHVYLRMVFDVRCFSDGTARVDVIGENTLVNNATTDALVYDVSIAVNGSTVYTRANSTGAGTVTLNNEWSTFSQAHGLSRGDVIEITSGAYTGIQRLASGIYNSTQTVQSWNWPGSGTVSWKKVFKHWAGSRWRKTLAAGGYTEATYTPDFTAHYAAKIFPAFLDTVSSSATWPELGDNWHAPMNFGSILVPTNLAGTRADIGPYQAWHARYLVHRTAATREISLGHGDTAGTFPIHFSDSDTKPLISLDDYPTWSGSSFGNGGAGIGRGEEVAPPGSGYYVSHFQMDVPHQSSHAFVPYAYTGDRYLCDEVKFWANHCLLSSYSEGPTTGMALHGGGTRGQAYGWLGAVFNATRGWGWGLRQLIDAAVWIPDDDQYKSYFLNKLQNNLEAADDYADLYNNANVCPWGGSFSGYTPNWPESGTPVATPCSPWMDTYLMWSLDRAHQLGFADGKKLRLRVATMWNNIYNSASWPEGRRAVYRIFLSQLVDPNFTIQWIQDIDDVYAIMDAEPTWNWDDALTPYYGQAYGPEMRLAYLVGIKLGLPNAQAAYDWLMAYEEPTGGRTFLYWLNIRSQFAVKELLPDG